jgi:hypothetical protein
MSLILDALRKLEREKDARAPGVLVVGSVPWGGSSRPRRLALWAAAALVLALAVLLGWLLRRAPAAPAAVVEPHRAASPAPSLAPATPPESPRPRLLAPPVDAAVVPPPIRLGRPLPPDRGARPAGAQPAPAPMPAAAAAAEPTPPGETPPPAPQLSLGQASTAPASTPPPGAPSAELRLNAISQRDGRPVALINDRLVFEGDSFDGVKILRIGEAEVEVEVHGQRRVLRF